MTRAYRSFKQALKTEQLLKFLIQRDAEHQGQFCGRVKLPRLNRADSIPADAYQPGQINTGDLMLYGSNCIVLFYKSFSSGYSYTRLGSIDDPVGLADALGRGNVTVTFSAQD